MSLQITDESLILRPGLRPEVEEVSVGRCGLRLCHVGG